MSAATPNAFTQWVGDSALVISLPHGGTRLPDELATRLTPVAHAVPDTDWHVGELYGFARELGASWLEAHVSRYVVDLNRPPDDAPLYPGQVATGLCPTHTFAGEPLYVGATPEAGEIAARRLQYWAPYHAALVELLALAQARHGHVVLLDAHSIPSHVPRLFAGRLPDINVGSFDGQSCDPGLVAALMARLAAQQRFTQALDGRFKGGYITRAYGRPARGVHAIQFELAQAAYMDEASRAYQPARAQALRSLLGELVQVLREWWPPRTAS